MADFHRTAVNDETFIRGAARLMIANVTVTFPSSIGCVINMSTYAASTDVTFGPWTDLGATKGGVTISVNSSEESFDVDQITGDLRTLPTNWECSVQTQLAELSLDRLQVAWEGSAVTTDATVTPNEKEMGFGQPLYFTERRLAVLFQRPYTTSNKIRGFFFRRVVRASAESSVVFNKAGEQQSVTIRFRALPDLSVADPYKRFFTVRDQQ